MEKETVFEYTYSSEEQEELRRIREKYLPKEENKLDQLRRLDEGVTRKGTVAALVMGILSCLVFGTGMSLCLVWQAMLPGIVCGIAGMVGMAAAYPLYAGITRKEREKVAPEILRLTEELMK